MLHDVPGDARRILQVEINTISSGLGFLSTKIADMQRTLADEDTRLRIPENIALSQLVMGLHAAHAEYLRQTQRSTEDSKNVLILFVVQPAERNFADQRALEHGLLRTYGVRCVRATLTEIGAENSPVSVDASGRLFYNQFEVSVVYFRAGYTPNDYFGESEWAARRRLEASMAIKCPDIAYHLIGTKKVQQVLAAPGVLERFVSASKALTLRTCFAGLYNLDPSEAGASKEAVDAVIQEAIARPHDFVLKPQREGGGNNYYKEVRFISI
jgi:glutathione synthase